MYIENQHIKNVFFSEEDRPKAESYIKRMIAQGWFFTSGGFDEDGKVFDSEATGTPYDEVIQICKLDNPVNTKK